MPVFASTEVAYFEWRWQHGDAFAELKKVRVGTKLCSKVRSQKWLKIPRQPLFSIHYIEVWKWLVAVLTILIYVVVTDTVSVSCPDQLSGNSESVGGQNYFLTNQSYIFWQIKIMHIFVKIIFWQIKVIFSGKWKSCTYLSRLFFGKSKSYLLTNKNHVHNCQKYFLTNQNQFPGKSRSCSCQKYFLQPWPAVCCHPGLLVPTTPDTPYLLLTPNHRPANKPLYQTKFHTCILKTR